MYGGRWNSAGHRVVYSSESLALAALEYLVHIPAEIAPDDLVALEIEVPDDLAVESTDPAALPAKWFEYSGHDKCQELGDEWARAGRTAVLKVPSAPVPSEHNYLLNTTHSDFSRITVVYKRAFHFDPRLVK